MNGVTDEKLDLLFPQPSPPPTSLSPQRWPGISVESTAALLAVLKDNHKKYHIFFNNMGFHNHITHRALALYALGASGPVIEGLYKLDGANQRPAFKSPEEVTTENFNAHLGDENYFEAYTTFFFKTLSEKGAAATLEEYIFSDKYNFISGGESTTQPEMLFRFVDGVLHPMIHAGYGLEFGLVGMLAEGLAMTAVHKTDVRSSILIPPTLFTSEIPNSINAATSHLASLVLNSTAANVTVKSEPRTGTHPFDVLARMLKDPRFPQGPRNFIGQFPDTLAAHAEEIRKYAEQWTIDLSKPGELDRKMEELIWTSSLMYGIGGWDKTSGFKADFFLMHLVTSSLFLPSVLPYLAPRSQALLMRAYFVSSLTWWVARGRPGFDIKEFFASTSALPTPPGETSSHSPTPNVPLPHAQTPNPWLPLLQSTIVHPNDHFAKIQRAFAHFGVIYGTCAAGYFKGTELEGAEHLDGSLFIRAAGLTSEKMGWTREGQEGHMWSFEGFYVQ
ncbi:hypothetical protein BV22DRAFT_1131586 [Leucogyrophana mollusca]|uniref:Uncharacterized protein n=1 Tax=Leucogyrophana mollusca TaxID=85980 RepID=A0ACB8B9C5_9AGAM|nr:hypothetical protein BV22DRAFT_1131586 [Leucogyrophana mollusca]